MRIEERLKNSNKYPVMKGEMLKYHEKIKALIEKECIKTIWPFDDRNEQDIVIIDRLDKNDSVDKELTFNKTVGLRDTWNQ